MDRSPLERLPNEILRHIASHLQPVCGLSFIQTCHHINKVCDEWKVWQDIAKGSSSYRQESLGFLEAEKDGWKKYVIADSMVTRGIILGQDSGIWLPQVIALNHEKLHDLDFISLLKGYQTIIGKEVYTNTGPLRPTEMYRHPGSLIPSSTWHQVQVLGFSLTARLLRNQSPESDPMGIHVGSPFELLHTVDWLELDVDISSKDNEQLISMAHGLANRALFFFALELQQSIRLGNTVAVSNLPETFNIPMYKLLKLQQPLLADNLKRFRLCHLEEMANPEFFTGSDWTGYMYSKGSSDIAPARFPGIGQDFPELRSMGPRLLAMYGIPTGKTVQFEFLHWKTEETFVIRSNFFHTRSELRMIKVTVNKTTGVLELVLHCHRGYPMAVRTGVITPFGIIECDERYESWCWLWKCEWSQ